MSKYKFMVKTMLILIVGVIFLTSCGANGRNQQMLENFKDNGRDEPYVNKIPLNEMDFSVYDKYFLYAPIEYNYERKITLPCDVEYYSTKEDSDPALILAKGTEVYVLPEGSSIIRGYGVQCWPDYEKGWRYGTPFLSFDFASLEDVYQDEEIPMYYVKTEQLERIAEEFYETNPSIVNTIRKAEFVKRTIRHIDQILYDNGAFLSEELLEK